MAYPGETACRAAPDCSAKYDYAPDYSVCQRGTRSVQYTIHPDSMCNQEKQSVPDAEDRLVCEVCGPGSYVSTDRSPRCADCPAGQFSQEPDAAECQVCPAGKRAERTLRYENLEAIPRGFSTRCERSVGSTQADICAVHKGWLVADGGLTAYPYFPPGARLILRTVVNVTNAIGHLNFSYQSAETQFPGNPAESFKVRIDGDVTGKPCTGRGRTASAAHGKHVEFHI